MNNWKIKYTKLVTKKQKILDAFVEVWDKFCEHKILWIDSVFLAALMYVIVY